MRESERAAAALSDSIALMEHVRAAGLGTTVAAAGAIAASLRQGGKVLVFGNGGSAADAAHTAAELVGRFMRQRPGYAAVALTTDGCVMTAVANDYGYDQVFARQIEALGQRGDVVLGITTSGNSPNVIRGLETARALHLTAIAVTGKDGGAAGRAADIHINVPSDATPRVQEVQMALLHIICDLVESALSA